MKFLKDFFSVLAPEDPSKTKQNKKKKTKKNKTCFCSFYTKLTCLPLTEKGLQMG